MKADAIVVRDRCELLISQLDRAVSHDVNLVLFDQLVEFLRLLIEEGSLDLSAVNVDKVYGEELSSASGIVPLFDVVLFGYAHFDPPVC